MKGIIKYLCSDMDDAVAVQKTLEAETAHLRECYEQQVRINELQTKIDKLRREGNGAWWKSPPEDRMRKALESIAIHVIYNDPVDANHVLKICKVALTDVNKEHHNGNNTDTVG